MRWRGSHDVNAPTIATMHSNAIFALEGVSSLERADFRAIFTFSRPWKWPELVIFVPIIDEITKKFTAGVRLQRRGSKLHGDSFSGSVKIKVTGNLGFASGG